METLVFSLPLKKIKTIFDFFLIIASAIYFLFRAGDVSFACLRSFFGLLSSGIAFLRFVSRAHFAADADRFRAATWLISFRMAEPDAATWLCRKLLREKLLLLKMMMRPRLLASHRCRSRPPRVRY